MPTDLTVLPWPLSLIFWRFSRMGLNFPTALLARNRVSPSRSSSSRT